MGAQAGGGDAAKRMQLAAAGRARRADAISRKEGGSAESNDQMNEAFMGGDPNFDERGGMDAVPGEGQPYDARGQYLPGGLNERPNMSPTDLGRFNNRPGFAEFLQRLSERRGGNK